MYYNHGLFCKNGKELLFRKKLPRAGKLVMRIYRKNVLDTKLKLIFALTRIPSKYLKRYRATEFAAFIEIRRGKYI